MAWHEEPRIYLLDTNAVIGLLRTKPGTRLIEDLGKANRLKLLDSVCRELSVREGSRAKSWVKDHPQFSLEPVQAVLDEIARVSRNHGSLFTANDGAADPALAATGIYFRASEVPRVIVTGDHGLQAVCVVEDLRFIPLPAFERLYNV